MSIACMHFRRAMTVKKCLRYLEGLVGKPNDQADELQNKMLVFCTICACSICGVAWGIIFSVNGAHWASIFPYMFAVFGAVGNVHLYYTKDIYWAHSLMCYGLSFAAMGIHWSFGRDHADYVINWSLLGPQLAMTLGYGVVACCKVSIPCRPPLRTPPPPCTALIETLYLLVVH